MCVSILLQYLKNIKDYENSIVNNASGFLIAIRLKLSTLFLVLIFAISSTCSLYRFAQRILRF